MSKQPQDQLPRNDTPSQFVAVIAGILLGPCLIAVALIGIAAALIAVLYGKPASTYWIVAAGALFAAAIAWFGWWWYSWRRTRIRVRRSRLSAESFRSWGVPDYYEDDHYICIGCGSHCVFAAKEQQHQYQVEKQYIWSRRNRCESCQEEWSCLRRNIASFPDELRRHPTERRLGEMLQELRRFRVLNNGTVDTALCNRILRLLAPNVSSAVRQAAYCVIFHNCDYNDLVQSFGVGDRRSEVINEHEVALAMRLCDEAGIDLTRTAIWRDLDTITQGLQDQDLKKWLKARDGD